MFEDPKNGDIVVFAVEELDAKKLRYAISLIGEFVVLVRHAPGMLVQLTRYDEKREKL